MKEFIAYISQFGNFNQQQIDFISKKAKMLELHKDEYLVEAEKSLTQVSFVVEGILRVCHYNNKGEEITRYFFDENHLIANCKEENSTEEVQATTHCKLLVFSNEDWQEFSNTISGWDTIMDKIIQKTLAEKLQRRSPLIEQDATTRYLTFMEKFPTLANRIPLAYIASYLGITRYSLSRIRKNIR